MDLGDFYSLMAATSFTLVGLWWTVVQKRADWKSSARHRALAGGTYLSFLLPGLMSTLARISPEAPVLWRLGFGSCAAVGLWSTGRLLRIDQSPYRGPFRRHRWIVTVIYVAVLLLGVLPGLARLFGVGPLTVGAVLLVLLIVLAHGLTWEFLMQPEEADQASGTPSG